MPESLEWNDVAAAVASGRDDELRDVLRRLTILAESGSPVTIEPPSAEWLEGLDDVSEDTLLTFLDLLYTYPFIEPIPSPDERREEAVDANLRYGTHRTAFHHALLVSLAANPDEEADRTLSSLRARGLRGDAEVRVAQHLVSNLLDHAEVRRATVRGLCWMKGRDDTDPVVAYVRPQLEADEIAELSEW